MKITKNIILGILFVTLILSLGFYIISMPFRLANMIDGEVVKSSDDYNDNELFLNKTIYLDKRTFFLAQRINKELSKIIVMDTIDSLCWNDNIIIGHANKKYFIVNVFENDSTVTNYYKSRASLCKDTNLLKSYYNRYYNVPIMHGFASSKF